MDNTAQLWEKVMTLLKRRLTSTTIGTFFDETTVIDVTDTALILDLRSELKRDVVRLHYVNLVEDCLLELFSVPMQVEVLAGEDEVRAYRKNVRSGTPFLLGADFTFDTFVVGNSNRFAHAAAVAVAENPARAYNPLFLHGGSGLGKTHLLYAIAHEVRKNNPDSKIAVIKGDDFTNELIAAIKQGKNMEFREKYCTCDLFLVDDIQFIAGKEATQEEFFHTFNTLYEAAKQIVLTSDRPPREMTRLEERLKSRFEWGLISDIQSPDYETRVVIIRNKAASLGLTLPEESVHYIAETITTNVRQIEGTVKKVLAFRDLLHLGVNMDTVTRAVEDVFKEHPGMNPTADIIIEETAKFCQIPEEDLRSDKRGKDIVRARHIAIYLIRTMTKMSFADIGEALSRHHTTVMHSMDTMQEMLEDPRTANDVQDIIINIQNR